MVDAAGRMGPFVLTGSQNLSLLSRVTQSLAGRTALVELLPPSVAELRAVGRLDATYATHLVNGFLPAVHARDLEPHVADLSRFGAIHPALVYGSDTRFDVDVMPWSGL